MRGSLQRIALAVVSCLLAAQAFAQLSPVEERIVAAVKARGDDAIRLLERTVNVNSGTLNVEGVREVGKLFGGEFERLGFRTRWAEMPPEVGRAGHLVAWREGTRGRRLLLIGHLDTVFEKHSPTQVWERSGDRVRGQGVIDMKGGNVIVVEALRALDRAGVLDDTTITIVFTGDEERVGSPVSVTRRDLIDAAKRSDAALSFEGVTRDKAGRDMATVARRASGGFTLTVTAQPAHSAGMFSEGVGFGAVYEGVRILNAFREKVAEPGLSFSPGVVLGGTVVAYDAALGSGTAFGKGNVIPRSFTAVSDMRYVTTEQGDRARVRMREIVSQSLPGTSAEIRFGRGYPPMAATPGNIKLLEMYSKASEDAGLGPIGTLEPTERGSGDIQFVAPYLDCLDGLGAAGRGSHTVDETIEIRSLERGAIRAALMIYRLTR